MLSSAVIFSIFSPPTLPINSKDDTKMPFFYWNLCLFVYLSYCRMCWERRRRGRTLSWWRGGRRTPSASATSPGSRSYSSTTRSIPQNKSSAPWFVLLAQNLWFWSCCNPKSRDIDIVFFFSFGYNTGLPVSYVWSYGWQSFVYFLGNIWYLVDFL